MLEIKVKEFLQGDLKKFKCLYLTMTNGYRINQLSYDCVRGAVP